MYYPNLACRRAPLFASVFAISCLFVDSSFAHTGPTKAAGAKSESSARRAKLGTPASVLEGLLAARTSETAVYTFVSPTGDRIPSDVKDYYFGEGKLSMTGVARGSQNSSFILKGTDKEIYGWVVLRDRNVAYEYTTNAQGEVIVEEVPVTKIYPICNVQPPPGMGRAPSSLPARTVSHRAGPEPHIGDYDGTTSVNKLESLPGAKLAIYLDITDIMNGEDPITLSSKEEMWLMWQSVASSFSMYEVNVTTSADVYAAVGVANSAKACFYNQDGRSNSPLNAWGTSQCSTNYKNVQEGYGLGRTGAHELGHTMGMKHDGGQPGGEYFEGLPDFEWVPVMGNYWFGSDWDQALYQWSKGEYGASNNGEDDLAIMERNIPYRADDIPDTKALALTGTTVDPLNNRGQITPSTDSDTFTFEVGASGGHAKLKLDRTEYIGGAMLDIDAAILDSGGAEVAQSNVSKARYAEFDVDLPAGSYKLVIKGGAEGTPDDGFSNYSSLGFYAIEGTIDGGMGTGGTGGTGGMGGAGGNAGTGGSAGTGGDAGTGGASGMGGTGGAGGGGTGGTAGTAGVGGTAGTGGTGTGGTGTGGTAGAGGSAGVGGAAGAGTGGTGPAGAGGTGGLPTDGVNTDEGCGCRLDRTGHGRGLAALGSGVLALMALGRRRYKMKFRRP